MQFCEDVPEPDLNPPDPCHEPWPEGDPYPYDDLDDELARFNAGLPSRINARTASILDL